LILNIILAVIIIGFVVVAHEFGHFIVAKANGIAVIEFSVGFGPNIIHKKINGTDYCLKAIPFGGACVMKGDDLTESLDAIGHEKDDEEDTAGLKNSDSEPEYRSEGYAKQAHESDLAEVLDKAEVKNKSVEVNAFAASDDEKEVQAKDIVAKSDAHGVAFSEKGIWSRIAVIAAGPIFNFILAYIFAVIIIGIIGIDPLVVDVVNEDSPAYVAGLRVGDKITSINGSSTTFTEDLSYAQTFHDGETWNLTVLRDDQKLAISVTPEKREYTKYMIGISIKDRSVVTINKDSPAAKAGLEVGDLILKIDGNDVESGVLLSEYFKNKGAVETDMVVKRGDKEVSLKIIPDKTDISDYYYGFDNYGYRTKVGPFETFKYGLKQVNYWIKAVVKCVGMLFTGKLSINNLSGPVGIVDSVNTVVQESKPDGAFYVMLNLFNFIIMLSANLGVMNLIPLPALDGGRLLFLLIELVRGKPVKKEHEGMVHFVGMILLMLLMVYILFKDIYSLF